MRGQSTTESAIEAFEDDQESDHGPPASDEVPASGLPNLHFGFRESLDESARTALAEQLEQSEVKAPVCLLSPARAILPHPLVKSVTLSGTTRALKSIYITKAGRKYIYNDSAVAEDPDIDIARILHCLGVVSKRRIIRMQHAFEVPYAKPKTGCIYSFHFRFHIL